MRISMQPNLQELTPLSPPLVRGEDYVSGLVKGEECARHRIIPLLTKEGLGEVKDGVL